MTATEPILEADVVEDDTPNIGQALTVVPRRSEVLYPLDVAQQAEAMKLYQAGLQQILDPTDWQDAGRDGKFVKKSGWRKIAAWFDLSIELVRDEVERDENGQVVRAKVWARALAASGRFADGDGYCDVAESRFARDKGRQKLENDLRGTATTRAVNRAISNLVGMGAVSAEEIDNPTTPGQPFGPAADPDTDKAAKRALGVLARGNGPLAAEVFQKIGRDCGGYFPAAAAAAVLRVAEIVTGPSVEAPEIS